MITVANRATPHPPTLEQNTNAMGSESDPLSGPLPGSAEAATDSSERFVRPTLRLPRSPSGERQTHKD